jgi:hypothetical protein
MEVYSAMKKNEIMQFASKCMKLKNIMLSDMSEIQQVKDHIFPLIYVS